jgi:hypothetical protein
MLGSWSFALLQFSAVGNLYELGTSKKSLQRTIVRSMRIYGQFVGSSFEPAAAKRMSLTGSPALAHNNHARAD